MASGGARNRSGPAPDPNSGRSDRRGYTLTALPNEGYKGKAPAMTIGKAALDDLLALREVEIWVEAWTTPQACAWSMQQWRWPIIAEYCRLKALVEFSPSASAALVGQLHRYRDQLGLTPAGMKDNGWAIAPVEVGPAAAPKKPARKSSREKLRVVGGDGA